MTLSLVLIEDHQALREGLELLLDREGLEVVDADPERRVVLHTGSSDVELLIIGLDSGARGYANGQG